MKKQIRIKRNNKNGELDLRLVDITTKLKPIEIPNQVDLDKHQGIRVVLHYPNSTERYKSVNKDSLKFVYGETSGRVKEVSKMSLGDLYRTDLYKLCTLVKNPSNTVRFNSNVKDGLELVGAILELAKGKK